MSRLLFHVCCIRCKQSSYSSTLYHVPGIVYRNRGITYRIYCHGFVTLRVSRLELKTTVKYPPPQNHRALRPRWRGGHELPLDLLCAALSIAGRHAWEVHHVSPRKPADLGEHDAWAESDTSTAHGDRLGVVNRPFPVVAVLVVLAGTGRHQHK